MEIYWFLWAPYSQDRPDAWNFLRHLGIIRELPWMVCGDFNEILYGFEKKVVYHEKEERKLFVKYWNSVICWI